MPPSLYIYLNPSMILFDLPLDYACMRILSRSRGAVRVREIAPAIPPAISVTKLDVPFFFSSGTVTLSPISIEFLFQKSNV